jgi:prefoldin subunit 5
MKEPWEYLNKLIEESPGLTVEQYASKFNEYEKKYEDAHQIIYKPSWTETAIMRLIKTINDHPNTFHNIGPFNCLNGGWYCSKNFQNNSNQLFTKITELESEIRDLRQQIVLLQGNSLQVEENSLQVGDSGI